MELTHASDDRHIISGGKYVDSKDPTCTHIVVDAITGDESLLKFDPNDYPNLKNTFVVYKEWFWSSIVVSGREDEFMKSFAYPAEVRVHVFL